MNLRLLPAALVAVACGAGLTACGTEPGTPAAAGSAGYGTSAAAPSPGASGVLGVLGVSVKTSQPATSGSRGTHTAPASSPAGVPASSLSPSGSAASSASPRAPASSASSGSSSGSAGAGSFTVPSISGDNVVSAYGSYTKINAEKVKVTVCAKQTGAAYSVGAIALAYNTSGASKNVGAVVLTGPGNMSCGEITFLFYSAHLKVHAFIGGNNGEIKETGPVLTVY